MTPAPVVAMIRADGSIPASIEDAYYVVRDDLLPGGTKIRAVGAIYDGSAGMVYGGPCEGYAQVALATFAAQRGIEAVTVTPMRKILHPNTAAAIAAGATHRPISPGYLGQVRSEAKRIARLAGYQLVPFGLDHPDAIEAIALAARTTGLYPPEVWCAVGSGVLTRSLQKAWPTASHTVVQVGKDPGVHIGRARLLRASERFDEPSRRPLPPFPSAANYDAKVWPFFVRVARPGAVFWNVAP